MIGNFDFLDHEIFVILGSDTVRDLIPRLKTFWDKEDVVVEYSSNNPWVLGCAAHPAEHTITIPSDWIKSYWKIAAVLHETGHIILHTQETMDRLNDMKYPDMLKVEAEAWLWALEFLEYSMPIEYINQFIVTVINSYWQAREASDFSGHESDEWWLLVDIIDAEYDKALNKFELREDEKDSEY